MRHCLGVVLKHVSAFIAAFCFKKTYGFPYPPFNNIFFGTAFYGVVGMGFKVIDT